MHGSPRLFASTTKSGHNGHVCHGIKDIGIAAQAAQALKPIAGEFAFVLFSISIIDTGLLAIPMLAGSALYAMSGAFH